MAGAGGAVNRGARDPVPLVARVFGALSDGAFHSGENLARALGVSRSAVWKASATLRQLGVTVHAVRNRGYRLANLDAQDLDIVTGSIPRNPVMQVPPRFQAADFPKVDRTLKGDRLVAPPQPASATPANAALVRRLFGLAWRYRGSLYAISEHVAPPFSYTKVAANLHRMLGELVVVRP